MGDLFFHSAGNPEPQGATGGFLTARDGVRLRYGLFPVSNGPTRGTVIMSGGRNECIEKYFETARDLGQRGLASVTMDWRGQGGSGRLIRDAERGHVARFDDYVDDLDLLFREVVLPDCRGPYYVLGHSTGSLIALLASPILTNRVQRMVLVAPFLDVVGLRMSLPRIGRIGGVLARLGLGTRYAYGGSRPAETPPFATNKLTTDQQRYRRNTGIYEAHPQLGLGGPTIAWVTAACTASLKVQSPAFVAGLHIPLLFIAAGADEVVSNRAIEAYAARIKSASLLTIDGARHELLQEADIYREQLFAAFDAFIPGSGEPG